MPILIHYIPSTKPLSTSLLETAQDAREDFASPLGTLMPTTETPEPIDVLVRRGLMEYVDQEMGEAIELLEGANAYIHAEKGVKVHDVLRDLAIDIGRSEENWFFGTAHHLQDFPSEDKIRDCKKISVGRNDIQDLPTDLICSNLVSLVLANNEKIIKVSQ